MGESKAERNLNVVAIVIGIPLAALLLIWATWITVTAFVGGQAPFFFIDFDGFSLLRGLFWLVGASIRRDIPAIHIPRAQSAAREVATIGTTHCHAPCARRRLRERDDIPESRLSPRE